MALKPVPDFFDSLYGADGVIKAPEPENGDERIIAGYVTVLFGD